MTTLKVKASLAAMLSICACTSQAAPINSQSILVSHITGNGRGEIIEFSRTGEVLQSFLVPRSNGNVANVDLRALAMDKYGRLQIFNGTFAPSLTTLTPQAAPGAATFEHRTIAGWSVIGNTSYGAVAIDHARDQIYVNDMSTASTGGPAGIIRFDSNPATATRVKGGEYTKVTFGLDGLLYASFPATRPGNNQLDVIDPTTYSVLRTVTLPRNAPSGSITYAGFAVDALGNIYATEGREWGRAIAKFDSQGTLIKRLSLGLTNPWPHDLALSPDGTLVTLSHFGDVAITTTDLNSFSIFRNSLIASDHSFVALAVTTVPEPSTSCLILCGSAAMACFRKRRIARSAA